MFEKKIKDFSRIDERTNQAENIEWVRFLLNKASRGSESKQQQAYREIPLIIDTFTIPDGILDDFGGIEKEEIKRTGVFLLLLLKRNVK